MDSPQTMLVNPLSGKNEYLYHFTKSQTVIDIFGSETLKLNSFSNVNDPRESKDWDFATLVPSNLNYSPEEYDRQSKELSDFLKKNSKMICFCSDKTEAVGKWMPEALFYRGYSKPAMWHHYADQHTGACLIFEKSKLENAFKKRLKGERLYSRRVAYSNEGYLPKLDDDPFFINLLYEEHVGIHSIVSDHLGRWFESLFFRKLVDWASEDEFRFIYFDTDDKSLFVPFDDALTCVLLGEAVFRDKENLIEGYCRKNKVPMAKMNWRNGFPRSPSTYCPWLNNNSD